MEMRKASCCPVAGAPVTSYQVECSVLPPRGRERDTAWQLVHDGSELACKARMRPEHASQPEHC